MPRRPGRCRSWVTALGATAALLLALCSCGSGGRAASPTTTVTSTTTTSPPPATTAPVTASAVTTTSSTTTTTVDPGAQPQTSQLPSPVDPQFLARMTDLVQAVATGRAATAAPAFFPLGAYIQVKGISDPVHDYQTRLIPDFDEDITALHSEIDPTAAPATFESVYVPAAAEWIQPGVEYNKGSYWRVYDSRLDFEVGGRPHYFTIASLISWRGEWYVVHLSSIR